MALPGGAIYLHFPYISNNLCQIGAHTARGPFESSQNGSEKERQKENISPCVDSQIDETHHSVYISIKYDVF